MTLRISKYRPLIFEFILWTQNLSRKFWKDVIWVVLNLLKGGGGIRFGKTNQRLSFSFLVCMREYHLGESIEKKGARQTYWKENSPRKSPRDLSVRNNKPRKGYRWFRGGTCPLQRVWKLPLKMTAKITFQNGFYSDRYLYWKRLDQIVIGTCRFFPFVILVHADLRRGKGAFTKMDLKICIMKEKKKIQAR